MFACPVFKILRRTKMPNSDRLILLPKECIAHIEYIIANLPEPVSIRLLAFHTKDNAYCLNYKDTAATKRFCVDNPSVQYTQFHISIETNQVDSIEYLIAFLPRLKTEDELNNIVNEFYTMIQWLGITQRVYGYIFRFGRPVHSSDNIKHWQYKLDQNIKKISQNNKQNIVEARIKHIDGTGGNRSLSVNNNAPFECIAVS